MHSYYLFKFYSVTTQETACLFLNESIEWLPDHSSHSIPHHPQYSLQSSLLLLVSFFLFFFLCAMESIQDIRFISSTQCLPTFPYAPKEPDSKGVKDDLGQPLREIIMEENILYISSNKLEEPVHERTVWV